MLSQIFRRQIYRRFFRQLLWQVRFQIFVFFFAHNFITIFLLLYPIYFIFAILIIFRIALFEFIIIQIAQLVRLTYVNLNLFHKFFVFLGDCSALNFFVGNYIAIFYSNNSFGVVGCVGFVSNQNNCVAAPIQLL